MTAAVLLDHVSAYAAAVRSYLSDLSPEQVEDLTDGLEADLAEALEDPTGVVATGEVSLHDGAGPASMIDLTRRFGPAAAYAAELRAAAGLEPPSGVAPRGRRPLRDALRGIGADLRQRAAVAAAPVTSARAWPPVAGILVALRPAWWMLRGWVWFVITSTALQPMVGYSVQHYVPETLPATLWLGAAVVLSVQWGRGLVQGPGWVRVGLRGATVVAVVAAMPLALSFVGTVQDRLSSSTYVEVPVYLEGPAAAVQDGVYVDGMQVSNLFVYDAEGNPLSGVQIFDDRGRQVRTTYDDGWQAWSLPGVDQPWSFAPSEDADGRARWNVYPLTGAPADQWTEDDEGERVLLDDAEPRTPPTPFAKAPAVVVPGSTMPRSSVTTGPSATTGADGATGAGAAAGSAPAPGTAGDAAVGTDSTNPPPTP